MTETNDIMSISNAMDKCNASIRAAVGLLKERARVKAEAYGNYEKEIAKKIIMLKMGEMFELDGVTIKETAASNVEKIARGICYKEMIAKEVAESDYKNLLVGIEALQSELNSLQSQYRHLDNK